MSTNFEQNAYPKSVEVGHLLERVIAFPFVELNLISAFVLADFKRLKLNAEVLDQVVEHEAVVRRELVLELQLEAEQLERARKSIRFHIGFYLSINFNQFLLLMISFEVDPELAQFK